ncbi:biopolymer transporter ExbD [Aeromonas sp. FDAARGOS 1409]|uniref:ExbD/TolR family protein n=1 Tax=Aeromonas TaxID=642 RepID=UPI001C21BE76|nr:biopolymer transporter ExbD [Aeromonas sp. FDAARGOS 1409]QXC29304.1 biopolymer transporter ExbD [Aeromonas sp. FDAARGOS 1409]
MAFGKLPGESDDQPLCEINMIPMIDVMLVLLIVFMITAPLLTNAVKLELPEASSQANQPRQEDVVLSIDGAGKIYWNAKEVDEATLLTRMSEAGQAKPEVPEIQLRIDKRVEYGVIARVMAQSSRQGLHKIAFVSQPGDE